MSNNVIFEATDSNNDQTLWYSDGTAAGTYEVGGPGDSGVANAPTGGLQPDDLVTFGDEVMFSTPSTSTQPAFLWISDGTAGGTMSFAPSSSNPVALQLETPAFVYAADIGGKVLFSGVDPISGGSSLWVTYGVPGGTMEIGGDGNAGVSPVAIVESGVTVIGSKGVFTAADSSGDTGLWVSDGTTAGTYEIGGTSNAGVTGAGPHGLDAGAIFSLGFTAVFAAQDSSDNEGLWITDGTVAGTHEIGGLGNAGVTGSPANLGNDLFSASAYDGVLYFADAHQNLWETDGTVAGTKQLTTSASSTHVLSATAFIGGAVFISNDNFTPFFDLWFTNGTTAGTSEIGGLQNAGIMGAPESGLSPYELVQFGNEVLFSAEDSSNNNGLWVTDGTAAGTVEIGGLADAGVAGASSTGLLPGQLTVSGGEVFFTGFDNAGNDSLWVTDGTTAGTHELSTPQNLQLGQEPTQIGQVAATSPAGPIFNGGGLTVNGADFASKYIYLNNTGAQYDTISASNEVLSFDNAFASITGGGDNITFANGLDAVSLYATSSNDDTVTGSNGVVIVNSSNVSIVGGSDVIYNYGYATDTLSQTSGAYDTLYSSTNYIYLTDAQASVVGGDDVINASGGSTASLYQTNDNADTVNGSSEYVILNDAQTGVYGGSDVVYMSGASEASLSRTAGNWDAVYGSNQIVDLNSAQASVVGGGDTIKMYGGAYVSLYQTNAVSDTVDATSDFVTLTDSQASIIGGGDAVYINGTGSTATLSQTSGSWDLAYSTGDTVTLNDAQASVVGGSNTINANTGSSVSLYQTNGAADTVNGASEYIILTSADASVVGGSNAIFVQGANTLSLSGASEAIYTSGLFGTDTIAGFALTDAIQFTTADFANYTALQGAMTQSGADTVITLDANDKITLSNVQMSTLTAANFNFLSPP